MRYDSLAQRAAASSRISAIGKEPAAEGQFDAHREVRSTETAKAFEKLLTRDDFPALDPRDRCKQLVFISRRELEGRLHAGAP